YLEMLQITKVFNGQESHDNLKNYDECEIQNISSTNFELSLNDCPYLEMLQITKVFNGQESHDNLKNYDECEIQNIISTNFEFSFND
ncbi:2485_t:CDS:1, partial [Gigaspora rosea]